MKIKMTESWKLVACSLLLAVQNIQMSSALLYIVRQNCIRGSVFTPAPALVNNVCLQCLCVTADISYCKPLIVQLSVTCSAAIVVTAPIAIPTIPTPTTTTLGINPRAASPAPAAAATMMMAAVPSGNAPVMMMVPMMMAAGMTAAGMMAPAPAPATPAAAPSPAPATPAPAAGR